MHKTTISDYKNLIIMSGSQTGVDRAALDWAIANGLPHEGWCPRGRIAEDGTLADYYHLKETSSHKYSQRTKMNIKDADGTLIIHTGELEGGTLQTSIITERENKPCLLINLEDDVQENIEKFIQWLEAAAIEKLNIAGPRESKQPGIYQKTVAFLDSIKIFRKS